MTVIVADVIVTPEGIALKSQRTSAALSIVPCICSVAALPLFVVLSLPQIVCGIYLLKFRPWARVLAIVLAILSLIHIPFGTIFGVYALVILFHKDTEALFTGRALPSLPSAVDRA